MTTHPGPDGPSSRAASVPFLAARWVIALIAVFGLGLVGLTLRVSDLPIAFWWPAAGVSLAFALRRTGRSRWAAIALILVATTASNAVGGRPWYLAILFGLCNTLEIITAIALLGRRRDGFRLDSLASAVRFVYAVLVGSAVAALAIAAVATTLAGADFVITATIALASHSSAAILIGSFAVLPPKESQRARPVELLLHVGTSGLALFVAFGPPANSTLSFLVFALLAGACLRFPLRVAAWQALLISIAVLLLTITSGGTAPLGEVASTDAAVTLVVFMSSVGIFTVLVAAARYESRRNAALAVQAAEELATAERARSAAIGQQLDLERQREDFVTATSHELRTPLTNILGYADLLLESPLQQQQRDWTAAVRRGAARLAALLDDLLQATGGAEPVRVSVDAVIADVRAAHGAEAAARRAEILTTTTGLHVVAVEADVRRALWSLVSNAVTFAERGTVRVTARRLGDDVAIVVSDDGPGMSPETLGSAFQRFYRGREAEGRASSGLGLGLATSRDLARRNGGDVTLTSTPGHGVEATLRLPVANTATI